MGVFTALNISASALSAERERSEVAVSNLASVDTTRTENGGGPYRRLIFEMAQRPQVASS
jgi:flagellar basal-body rod protein FlgC